MKPLYLLILCPLIFASCSIACAGSAYEDAAKEAINKKGGAYLEKANKAKNCLNKVADCLNNSEKVHNAIANGASKIAKMDECLKSTDREVQKNCMEMVKASYLKRKEEKERVAAEEAEKWAWDGQVGSEVRICTKGKRKPIGVVLVVTNSKVKLEINQAGGNAFLYYQVGDQPWIEKNMIGC